MTEGHCDKWCFLCVALFSEKPFLPGTSGIFIIKYKFWASFWVITAFWSTGAIISKDIIYGKILRTLILVILTEFFLKNLTRYGILVGRFLICAIKSTYRYQGKFSVIICKTFCKQPRKFFTYLLIKKIGQWSHGIWEQGVTGASYNINRIHCRTLHRIPRDHSRFFFFYY